MDIQDVGKLVVVIIVLIALLIVAYIYKCIQDKIFQNSISQSKLGILSGIDVKEDGNKCFIIVSNKSFSNVLIDSIGFKDSIKNYDFIKDYREKNNIEGDKSISIKARSSVKLEIDFDTIYDTFADFKVKKIYAYTIDSLGILCKKNCKEIRKQIVLKCKDIFKEKKKQMALEKKELKKNQQNKEENVITEDNNI